MRTDTRAQATPSREATAAILKEVRPHLSPALQQLPDDKLLALIHWDIFTAWERAIRELRSYRPKNTRGKEAKK